MALVPGTPVEAEFASANPWDMTVDFTGVDYVTLGFAAEDGTISSVVIDPAGSAVAMDLSVSAANGTTQCWLYYKALAGLGLSGSKTVRIAWTTTESGNCVRRTYSGAAQAAPTPTDTDNLASAQTLSNSLASPNVDGSLEWVGTSNAVPFSYTLLGGLTPSGFIRVASPETFTAGQGYIDGSLANPSIPGSSNTSGANRIACCAHVVNPSGAIATGPGFVEIIAYTPGISTAVTTAPDPAQLGITGYPPTVSAVDAAPGTIEIGAIEWLAQYRPTGDVNLDLGTGRIAILGYAPGVTESQSATAETETGILALTGQTPTFSATADVAANTVSGALVAQGLAPTVSAHHTASPTTGVLAAAGQAPSVSAGVTVEPAAADLRVVGFVPTVTVEGAFTAEPSAGTISLTGFAPTVSADAASTTAAGTLTLSALAASFVGSVETLPGASSLRIAGVLPTVAASVQVEPVAGQAVIIGYAPTVAVEGQFEGLPGAGTIAIVGQAPTASADAAVTASAATIQITGLAPTVQAGATAQPVAATIALAGFAPTVTTSADISLTPSAGTLAISAAAPSVAVGSTLTPSAGQIALTAYAPTVEATGSVSVQPTAGSISLAAAAPSVAADSAVAPAAGAVEISGQTASFAASVEIALSAGTLETTGFAPTVAADAVLLPATGTLAITGVAPTAAVTADQTVTPSAGTLAITGAAPTFAANVPANTNVGRLEVRGHAPEPLADASVTTASAIIGITGATLTVTGGTDVSTVEIGAVEWTVEYLPVSQSINTGAGTIGAEGHAPEFQAHFAATANDSNLRLLGYKVLLFGDRDMDPGVGVLRIVSYPPFILRINPPSRRNFQVNAQDRTAEVAARTQLVPVGTQDRQFAATGRRRVFRVGRRSGENAA